MTEAETLRLYVDGATRREYYSALVQVVRWTTATILTPIPIREGAYNHNVAVTRII